MRPGFVRFPGGCYIEGDKLALAFDWKRSVGPVEVRQGLAKSHWGYANTYGLGYHEYLQWCEDLGAAPLFVANIGLAHHEIEPMARIGTRVGDALDAIEYANGPVSSEWGALRARNGHPAPFGLRYVEIGNENTFGWGVPGAEERYAERYAVFHDAIKRRYPEITTIADGVVPHPMEIVDEHYYASPTWFWRNADRYDAYDRKGPRVYVGEYAVTQGAGAGRIKGNLDAALAEAAFMTGFERNPDVVAMSSYAPLLTNVNNQQWSPDAIVFDAARSYGTPSYLVQRLFGRHRPDEATRTTTVGAEPAPVAIGGTVGLQTWRTQARFSDVRLTVDGRARAARRVEGRAGDSGPRDGGALTQNGRGEGERTLASGLDLKGARAYTLELTARKLGGDEGFIVMLDQRDGSGLQWNLGGWENKKTAFQRDGAIVGSEPKVRIETGRDYRVRIEREGGTTRAYLDGGLVETLVETGRPDFVASSGVDRKARELVVKVVNGAATPRAATLDLTGVNLAPRGRAIVLSGPSLETENSFARPDAVTTREPPVTGVAPE